MRSATAPDTMVATVAEKAQQRHTPPTRGCPCLTHLNCMRSATAPDTIVAAVAENAQEKNQLAQYDSGPLVEEE